MVALARTRTDTRAGTHSYWYTLVLVHTVLVHTRTDTRTRATGVLVLDLFSYCYSSRVVLYCTACASNGTRTGTHTGARIILVEMTSIPVLLVVLVLAYLLVWDRGRFSYWCSYFLPGINSGRTA